MHTRVWKACTRTALAVAAGLSLAAGATLAVASPAAAAGTSSSSVIEVTNGEFTVILPNTRVGRLAAAGDITAFHGFSALKNITIQSQGFDLEGTITGRLRSNDYKALYQVYNMPYSASFDVWALKFKADASRSVLKKTFEESQLIDVNINIKFKVSAAALNGVSTLRIGFETLRLELDGTTKDFTVVNGASGSAQDQNNNDVPVDFEEI